MVFEFRSRERIDPACRRAGGSNSYLKLLCIIDLVVIGIILTCKRTDFEQTREQNLCRLWYRGNLHLYPTLGPPIFCIHFMLCSCVAASDPIHGIVPCMLQLQLFARVVHCIPCVPLGFCISRCAPVARERVHATQYLKQSS